MACQYLIGFIFQYQSRENLEGWYHIIQKSLGVDYEPNEAVIHDTHKMYIGFEQNPYDSSLSDDSWVYSPSGAFDDAHFYLCPYYCVSF